MSEVPLATTLKAPLTFGIPPKPIFTRKTCHTPANLARTSGRNGQGWLLGGVAGFENNACWSCEPTMEHGCNPELEPLPTCFDMFEDALML